MANNKKRSSTTSEVERADSKAGVTERTGINPRAEGKQSKTGKSRRPTRRENKFQKKTERAGKIAQKAVNALLENVNVESPVDTNRPSMMFPTDSASMQAFGNLITTPGQDNFIEDYNAITNMVPGMTAPIVAVTEPTVHRASNVMVLGFTHYFGHVVNRRESNPRSSMTNPLLLAATNLKQFIDTSFGTRTNYDPQDLMIYMMAISAVFPVIAEIKRNLRLAITTLPNQYPQFLPQGVYAALRIPDEDTHFYAHGEGVLYTAKHLRSYIDQLNQLILMFNRLPIPPEILAFQYNDDLFDAIFTDVPDVTVAQLYTFCNTGYWVYREADPEAETGAYLQFNTIGAGRWGIPDQLKRLQDMIEPLTALRTSSTAMLQNLYNAYGSRDTIQVPLLDINALDPLPFVYNEGMLSAIENCVITPGASFSDIKTDSADNSIAGYVEVDAMRHFEMAVDVPLQFHKSYDLVTKDDIGWALRFHPSFRTFEVSHDDSVTPVFSARGYTPFGFITSCLPYGVNDDGAVAGYNFNTRLVSQWDVDATVGMQILGDWQYAPIYLAASQATSDTQQIIDFRAYTSRRDVELTYRLEDTYMHWTYLTLSMWAGNINRNVQGSRMH